MAIKWSRQTRIEEPKKPWYQGGLNALQTIGDVISRPNYASANIAKTLVTNKKATPFDILKAGYRGLAGKDKTIYKDVLTSAGVGDLGKLKTRYGDISGKGAIGFGMDILLDPTTYLTLGTGTGAKIYTQQGIKTLSKQGTKQFTKEVAKRGNREAAEKAIGREIATSPQLSRQLVDRGGVKFAGKTLPGTQRIQPLFDATREKAFNLVSRDKQLGYKDLASRRAGQSFRDRYAGRINQFTTEVNQNFRRVGVKEREQITKAIYNGNIESLPQKLKPVAKFAQKEFRKIAEEEGGKELLQKTLKNYVTQYYKEKPVVKTVGLVADKTKTAVRYANPRKIIAKNWDEFVEKANKAGLTPEADIKKILMKRKNDSLKQVEKSNLYTNLAERFSDPSNIPAGEKMVTMPKIKEFRKEIPGSVLSGAKQRQKLQQTGKELGKIRRELDKAIKSGNESLVKALQTREKALSTQYSKFKTPTARFKNVQIPESVANWVNALEKTPIDSEELNVILRGYDKSLNFLKGTLTAWFPAFHARNAVSNIMQNWLDIGLAQSINPKLHWAATDITFGRNLNKTIDLYGTKYSYGQLKKMMEENGVLQGIGFFDVRGKTVNPGLKIGRKIENEARSVNFLANMMKIGDPVTAAERTKKFLFDYDNLNNVEKTVFKRIFPFWTWTAKNLALQAEQLIKQPGKFATQFKGMRDFQNENGEITDEEYNKLPDWMKNSFVIRQKGEDGKLSYRYGFGTPVEEFAQSIGDPGKKAISMLSPMLKYPLELGTGRDFFYDENIEDITDARGAGFLLKQAPGATGYTAREKRNTKTGEISVDERANPYMLHLLRQPPFSRFLSTSKQLSSGSVSGTDKAVKFTTGLNTMNTDEETQNYYKDKDFKESVSKKYENQGLIKRSQYGWFVPNNIGMTREEKTEANYVVQLLNDNNRSSKKKLSEKDLKVLLLASMYKRNPDNKELLNAMYYAVTGRKPKKSSGKKATSNYKKTPSVTLRTVKTSYKKPPKISKPRKTWVK